MFRVDEIEDAILSVLESDEELASYVKTFAPAPSLEAKDLETLAARVPAIGVISEAGTYSYALGGIQEETGSFLVVCINRNLRSAVASLRGGTASERGVWHMVEDCRRAILTLPGLGIVGGAVDCIPVHRSILRVSSPWASATLELEARWRIS